MALVAIALALVTASVTAPALAQEGLGVRGYVENTTGGDWRKARDLAAVMTANRLRLDLEASAGENVTGNAAVIGMLYAGNASFNVLDFLPQRYEAMVPAAFRSELTQRLEDDIWLQEAFVTFYVGKLRLRAGRQKINSGSGYAFNPSDVLNFKNPLDPTYELEGIDALRASLTFWGDAQLDLAYVFGSGHFRNRPFNELSDGDWRAALQVTLGRFDVVAQYTGALRPRTDIEGMLALTVIPASTDPGDLSTWLRWHFFGGEFSGEILGIGLRAEGGWVLVDDAPAGSKLRRDTLDHGRFLVSVDYTFEFQLELMAEYLFDGQGRANDAYDLNERIGLLAGERLTITRDTIFVGARYPLTDLLSLQVYAMFAPGDPSGMLNPWLVWDAADGLWIKATAQLPFGSEDSQNGRVGPGGFVRARMNF